MEAGKEETREEIGKEGEEAVGREAKEVAGKEANNREEVRFCSYVSIYDVFKVT